jgi:hypothetical protein
MAILRWKARQPTGGNIVGKVLMPGVKWRDDENNNGDKLALPVGLFPLNS